MTRTHTPLALAALAAVGLAAILPQAAHAQGYTLTTVASFTGGSDGNLPLAGLTLIGSTLYGTTSGAAGNSGNGTVFSVPLAGGPITTLATFNGANGTEARAGLTLSADGKTFYGTTEGSANGQGTVFSVPVAGGTITTLASFTGGADGGGPFGGLTLGPFGGLTLGPDGTLYGTAPEGGADGDGTVFALIPNAAPEPSQTAALGLGVLGLCGLAFKARKRLAA